MCWLWTHEFNHNKLPKASGFLPTIYLLKNNQSPAENNESNIQLSIFQHKKTLKGQSYAKAIGKEKKTLSTVTFTVYYRNQNATGM